MKQLWTEKYRPKNLADYVFTDANQRRQVDGWVKDGTIPHILLSGSPGTGKTTLAKILVNELGIDDYDFLQINASRDNGVDFIKDTVEGFVQTMPFGRFKVVLLDEADYLSHNAQAIMRGLTETYASQARFIFTCNAPHKIMPALHSRCQGFHIDKTDITEFTARAATVLVNENVEFDLDTLDTYVKSTYPDLRKCLNSLQMNSSDGTLIPPSDNDNNVTEWKSQVVNLVKSKQLLEARRLMCKNARPEEMEDLITWCYNNLDLWSSTPEGQDQAITIIRNAAVNVSFIADQEINVAAMMVELAGIQE